MDKRDELIELYLIYKSLLTVNEQLYFENYYYEDYSLNEIAENQKVSKANVSKVLNNTISKLNDYENKLKINYKNKAIKSILINEENERLLEKIDELL